MIIAENVLAGNQRGGPVKVSVVGGGQGGTKVWRRERIEMTEADLDDVAFLSGSEWLDNLINYKKKNKNQIEKRKTIDNKWNFLFKVVIAVVYIKQEMA